MNMTVTAASLSEDVRARLRALELRSFIVQAPAGSGKTELLTQRFLRLMAQVDFPEEVVALTFTNKAAAEMRSRIQSSLVMAGAGERPGDDMPHRQLTYDLGRDVLARDAQCGWQLLQHPGRLKITTIDALCGSLVRQMPLLSRLGGQPRVEPKAEAYYRAAARERLALVEDDGMHAECVRKALHYFHNDAKHLAALLAAMLEQRDQWPRENAGQLLRSRAQAGLNALVGQTLRAAAQCVDGAIQKEMMAATRHAARGFEAARALADWERELHGDVDELPRWRALSALLLNSKRELRKTFDARSGFPARDPQAKELARDLLDLIKRMPPETAACLERVADLPAGYSDEDWDIIEALGELLKLAEAHLWLAFRAAGAADFTAIAQNAIAQNAIAALGTEGEPTDLALALDYRIRHLLIDEFQDTSPNQVALVEAMTRGWTHDDGRTLFLVGDPMQSIYRFRKAEVGLFLDVAARGIGGISLERLRLHRNNRSDPVVVDWINRIFPAIFPSHDDARKAAISYAPCATDRAPCGQAAVHVRAALHRDDADGDDEEAQNILEIIDATRAADPVARIAVLVRARSYLDALVSAIRRKRPDLAYQAVEIAKLRGRQVVQDLLSLTHALTQQADRVHWLAILRAPWCGLTLADLDYLAADNHRSTLWRLMNNASRVASLSADGQVRLRHVRDVLDEAFAHQGRQHPRRWIEQVWRLLGGDRCLRSDADRQDADAYFALLEQAAPDGMLDMEMLLERINKLFSDPNHDADAQSVQLMTIHKSKGLEFDCVILPGLHRPPRAADRRLFRWEALNVPGMGQCSVPGAIPSHREEAGQNGKATVYAFLQALEGERDCFETQRLLYVAATRARKALHLLATLKPDPNDPGAFNKPPDGTLLELLWRSPAREAFLAAGQAIESEPMPWLALAKRERRGAPLLRIRTDFLETLRREGETVPSHPAAVMHMDDVQALSLDAAVGTLVHRCLEMIANDGLEQWTVARCA